MVKLNARQQARKQAHFVVQNRLAQAVIVDKSLTDCDAFSGLRAVDAGLAGAEADSLITDRASSADREQFGREMLFSVEKGLHCNFGICKLVNAVDWIDDLHPLRALDPERLRSAGVDSLVWLEAEGSFSLLAYAVLLKKWSVCRALLRAGADPLVRSHSRLGRGGENANSAAPVVPINDSEDLLLRQTVAAEGEAVESCRGSACKIEQFNDAADAGNTMAETLSAPVTLPVQSAAAKALLKSMPATFQMGMLESVLTMRMLAAELSHSSGSLLRCALCNQRITEAAVAWSRRCEHTMCEPCLWRHWAVHGIEEELGCPVCAAPGPHNPSTTSNIALNGGSLKLASLQRFESLPEERYTKVKKKGKARNWVKGMKPCYSLKLANSSCMGATKSERSEHFLRAVLRNDSSRVRALVEAGADIDGLNEYGQTALYQAAAVGAASVVSVLLAAAANAHIEAHDGTTAAYIAAIRGHNGATSVFVKTQVEPYSSRTPLVLTGHSSGGPITSMLIEPWTDHEGAGACMVDRAVSPSAVAALLQLHKELPVAMQEKESCSRRSYYCDSHRVICNALSAAIGPGTVVLPQMRFLNYSDSGGWLAPHIDLSRVDEGGRRSTHTFLLYLTTCEKGGETALLQSVNPEGGEQALAVVKPVAARLLVFPHVCPHEGRHTKNVPKILIRGELILQSNDSIS